MSRSFQGVKLIVKAADRRVLRAALPESLRTDFDSGHTYYDGTYPAILGDPLNLAQGLSWGAQYEPDAIAVWAVDPDRNMTLEQVREFERRNDLRAHPEIMFVPICQDDDAATRNFIMTNLARQCPWDTDLV
jgi:hypothetical protein